MLTGQDTGSQVSVITGDDATADHGSHQTGQSAQLPEDGKYDSKEEVALYIHLYGHLPSNYVTKTEARDKGWEGGGLDAYYPGCSIGGDKFGNSEGLLPKKKGRQYYECDIDTAGKSSRGAKRIVFSNDGLVYYTEDHYESFELLYGNP
ncbi:MAG: ribonuclease [Clostridia bacterium]|nr:ribonuclease [Clostridia bacterium]